MRRPQFREIRRVALYLRVSSVEQAKGHSLDSQRAELRAWAESEGWAIVGEYEDPGASGTSVQGRDGFQRMIADAQPEGFDAVLISRVDRFARSRRDSAVYKELLADHGVRVLSRGEPTVGDGTPAGFLTEGLFEVMAEHYSVQLSHNVARGKATRARKGLPLGDIPFGYQSRGAHLPPEVVPGEADAVRRCFEEYAAGRRSMLDLADMLNAGGFHPRSKRGRTVFSKATIAGMLSNPIYVGDITHRGEVVASGMHEQIVSREFWDKVQQMREERARKPQVFGARPRRPYLLTGVGICAACGSPLWANTTGHGRNSYYRCSARSRGEDCSDGNGSCRSELPERQIDILFARLVLPHSWRQRVEDLAAERQPEVNITLERGRLEDKIKRVQQGLLDGVLDNETAKDAIREAQAALAVMVTPDVMPVRAGERLTDIRELWPQMNMDERSGFVKLVLARVEVNLRSGDLGGMIPKPAFSPLFWVLAEEESGLISICGWRPRSDSNRRSPA